MISEVTTAPHKYTGLLGQATQDHTFDCKRRLLSIGKRKLLKHNLRTDLRGDFSGSIIWIEDQEERQFQKWLIKNKDARLKELAGLITYKEAILDEGRMGRGAKRWECWIQLSNVEWWFAGDHIEGEIESKRIKGWKFCACGCKRPTTGEMYISNHQHIAALRCSLADAERKTEMILRLQQELVDLDEARDIREKLLAEVEAW